jgi:hypothetical protein
VYPILSLWNRNFKFVRFSSIYRGLIISVIVTALFWLLLRILVKDWQKARLLTSMSVLLFFAYGHVYLFLFERWAELTRHRNIIGVYMGLFLFCGWLIIWKLKNLENVDRFFNINQHDYVGICNFPSGATKLFSFSNIK